MDYNAGHLADKPNLMSATVATRFADQIHEAIRSLVQAKVRQEGIYVKLPILYPSGSNVVVMISGSENAFYVTDFGNPHQKGLSVARLFDFDVSAKI